MTTIQVTLNVDDEVAEKLTHYNEGEQTHLNQQLENFLQNLVEAKTQEVKGRDMDIKEMLKDYPDWIKRLVVADKPTPDFDHKAEYRKHIEEKYGL